MRGQKHLLPIIAWNQPKGVFSNDEEEEEDPHEPIYHLSSSNLWFFGGQIGTLLTKAFSGVIFPNPNPSFFFFFLNTSPLWEKGCPGHCLPSAPTQFLAFRTEESKRPIYFRSSFQGPGSLQNVDGINGRQKLLHYVAGALYIRNLVSRKRRRLLIEGYDLDMSYITDRLLAMSFPAEDMHAVYRNPLWQVKEVLDKRHPGHYKVFNLCAEQSYDPSHFHGRVDRFPFDDHHVPSLSMVKLFCESVHSWLSTDPQNITVIHCMAGKGRTGLMLSAYLVYSGMSPDEALELYADKQTTNNNGVTIASQLRYVRYWSEILTFPEGLDNGPPNVSVPQPLSRELRRIRLYDAVSTKCVFFVVSELVEVPEQLYRPPVELARNCCRQIKLGCQRTNSPRYYVSFIDNEGDEKVPEEDSPHFVVQMDTESSAIDEKAFLGYYFDKPLLVSGDVRITFYEKLISGRLFYLCFNTAFITSSVLQFSLEELDKVGRKGKSISGPSFCVELLFGPANPKHPMISSEAHCEETENKNDPLFQN